MPYEHRTLPLIASDGDTSKWPPLKEWKIADDHNYRLKLGYEIAERNGTALPGTEYLLDTLPDGYRLFSKPTPAGNQTYKHLFGHPSGRIYDSIVRYLPHFRWLLDGQNGSCFCDLCNKGKRMAVVKPRKRRNLLDVGEFSSLGHSPISTGDDEPRVAGTGFTTERSRRTHRETTEVGYNVDNEGVRNVYKDAITAAYKNKNSRHGVDFDIVEDESMDWEAEVDSLQIHLTKIEQQHSFIPRLGELVLWIPQLAEGLCVLRDPKSGHYQAFNPEAKTFDGFPTWRGGVITQTPANASKDGFTDFSDLLYTPDKKTNLNLSGFKVETMVDPNDDMNKSASKQGKYVSLQYIRPLSQWQEVLSGIPQKYLHPSILHALTCMTSVSLLGKYKFKGDWQDGGFFLARGCYLGSELITVGDSIRLRPTAGKCTQVMAVDQIRLLIDGLNEEHVKSNSNTICSAHVVSFVGHCYTIDVHEASQAVSSSQNSTSVVQVPPPLAKEQVKTIFRPVGTADYGPWRHIGRQEVSYDLVLGRLYEAEAVRSWSGQRQWKFSAQERDTTFKPDLGYDLGGIIDGRKYATANDERIPDCPTGEIRWLIVDTRVQGLTLAYVNGLETSYYDHTRNKYAIENYRMHLRRAAGKPVDMPVGRAKPIYSFTLDDATLGVPYEGKRRGRPTGSKIIDGKMYTAEELQSHPELLELAKGKERETTEEGEELTISQKTPIKTSRMAAAAMDETDEESGGDLDRPEDDRLAAYGEPLSEYEDALEAPVAQAFSKSRIMESVEHGHNSTVANIPEYESMDEEDLWDSQKLAEWKDPRNARGGTEESEGGDYAPDD